MFRMFRKKATVFTLLFTMSLSQMAYASSTGEALSQKDAQTIDCNSCDLTINDEKKVLQDEELQVQHHLLYIKSIMGKGVLKQQKFAKLQMEI